MGDLLPVAAMAAPLALGMLPMIASALAGLGSGGGGGGGSAAAPVAADGGGGGVAGGGMSPEAERALRVLKALEAVYGGGDPSDPRVRELQQQLGVSPGGRGAGAGSIRATRLFQRTAAKAFNNLDNQLVSYVRGLAGSNKVDKKAVVGLVREVNVALAELGPQAYTKAGQRKVHQILTAALQKAQSIVSGGSAKSADTAAAINRLTKQYLYNIAGKNYRPGGNRNTAGASSATQRAIQIAAGELGVSEYAQNRVNRPYNINDAWCASFATWAWSQAGINVPWSNKNHVRSIWSDAQRMRLADSSYNARAGDLVILNGGEHIGMVVARTGNTITTIEGNSSDAVRQRTYYLGTSGMVGVVHPPS
ncbi:DUF4226 domain-containing protein [Nocardia sp. NBC_00508]|uniref:DUF4226 domain-containing protein n=1 Tax=Nocardia sp. NBC_00508 TaxID=2975992 RepID=UPI002E800D43|nr:DUF4226 domain-containing protein [Nocardia sp. NBC_00508]WUD68146.1 DUF4226 domain-containing protein [Nocardia sp. NBC_00508]